MTLNNIIVKTINKTLDFEKLYLDWMNNYLTLEKFSEDYQLSTEKAIKYIEIGRKIHNQNVKNRKELK